MVNTTASKAKSASKTKSRSKSGRYASKPKSKTGSKSGSKSGGKRHEISGLMVVMSRTKTKAGGHRYVFHIEHDGKLHRSDGASASAAVSRFMGKEKIKGTKSFKVYESNSKSSPHRVVKRKASKRKAKK